MYIWNCPKTFKISKVFFTVFAYVYRFERIQRINDRNVLLEWNRKATQAQLYAFHDCRNCSMLFR